MDQILRQLSKIKIKARIVSCSHLKDLQKELQGLRVQGGISEEFYYCRLSQFQFEVPQSLPEAKTLIIAAFPQPTIVIILNLDGQRFPVKIPPTYLYYSDDLIQKFLEAMLNPLGYRIAKSSLPLKLLAVRSGLGRYGRNNICYVPGLGSYHRLVAFFSDYPATVDSWGPARMANFCRTCQICLNICPTGAIRPNKFLISAERCLTYMNEGETDFPVWLNNMAHNAVVGCLRCQEACPQNFKIKDSIFSCGEFTEVESRILLESGKLDVNKMPQLLQDKLGSLNFVDYLGILSRNLRALINTFQL